MKDNTFSWKLGPGLRVEADALKDQDQRLMHTELLESIMISHALLKKLDGVAKAIYMQKPADFEIWVLQNRNVITDHNQTVY